ncbi:helix-turn-helix domain-containing protein [Streptomyces pakalii]|uniref:Helix-turn-helix domain-containing protein n=1 Tax=Streptomyces pakalii TaxID=3036494 RepID=A0ABT7DHU4_9ACTN|nr:helix-turn-helix domain-containing protein [Streptomyces pakalii]MDJ1645386.1 helix-turn-helix domain-containing protein [Streptomyces pakalii]
MPDAAPDMPALLKRWRARRTLADLPGADPADGDGPVTQTVMAEQLGISEHYYRRLESGRRPMSSDIIAGISRVLTLHPDEQTALYRWAGRPVPPLLAPVTPDVPDDLRDHIDRLPFPALLESGDFSVIAFNRRAARVCPWAARPGANVMIDLLMPGPGRDQCAQWEEHWAPPLLAQLRQGTALGNVALRAIVDRVCEDPQVKDLWDRDADLRRHAYGTVRPMHLDGWRPRPAWVRIMGWQPMHHPSLRVITGEPATNTHQPGRRTTG